MKPKYFAFLAMALTLPAMGQSTGYPQRPVKVVVGFTPGGPTDLVARAFADQAANALKQPFVVDNKPGANSTIAAENVASSKPDGYTLLAAATNHTMIPALYGDRVRFDADKSFTPICAFAFSDTVLVVGPSLPAKSVSDFLNQVKAKSNGATYGTPGVGSSPHLATEAFQKLTGAKLVHVPYKGGSQVTADLMAGQIDLSFATVGTVMSQVQGGRLTPLAVAARQRSSFLPKVPTFDEAGVKGFYIDTWYGLMAPAGVPAEVTAALQRAVQDFVRSPQVKERLQATGLDARASCGAEFASHVKGEIAENVKVAKELNLKAE